MSVSSFANEPHPCFFYGSLMSPAVLNAVTRPGPEANLHIVRATIEGYVRHPYHGEPYPGMILSKPGDTVEGLLAFGHTLIDRHRLDVFEGSEYTRKVLPVKVLDAVPASFTVSKSEPIAPGTIIDAYVYIFTGLRSHLDETREWDFESFKRDQLAHWMETSSEFQE